MLQVLCRAPQVPCRAPQVPCRVLLPPHRVLLPPYRVLPLRPQLSRVWLLTRSSRNLSPDGTAESRWIF
jgi:hypothetical protein